MKTRAVKWLLFLALSFSLPGVALAGPITTDFMKGPDNVRGNPTSGIYDPAEVYQLGPFVFGVTTLNPLLPTDQLNPSANFLMVLRAAFPELRGWTFVNSLRELTDGSLSVRTYDAVGTPAAVGADFHVKYLPGAGDPTAATHDIHWIQVVTDNHNVTNNPGHGNAENVVDNPFSPGGRVPYYDDGGAANATDFFDGPRRRDPDQEHVWSAELFLVTRPLGSGFAAGEVTVWSGVNWGWQNVVVVVPEPSSLTLLTLGTLGLLGYAWRRRKRAAPATVTTGALAPLP